MEKCDCTISLCDQFRIGEGIRLKDYVFSNDFTKNIDAMIYTCGYENCEPGHSYGPLLRNGYMVHYILAGEGVYRTRGKEFHLHEGDAFLICPGDVIYYEADQKNPWIYTWIGMQGIKIKGYLERTSLIETLVFRYGDNSKLRSCHERLFEAEQQTRSRDLLMNSILYEYLFLLVKQFPNKRPVVGENRANYVEEVLRFIEGAYCDPITVQDIADHLSLNRSYLHRMFKAVMGTSIQNYLLDYRIRRACTLLKNTDLPIHVVARSVSYQDALHFSKLFRQKKGVSPSEYREQRQGTP